MIWEPTNEVPKIASCQNILLVYGVHQPRDLAAINTILSKDEIEFSNRLKSDNQRNTWISCHVALRRMVGIYLGIHPIEIEFSKNHFGKPFLANSKLIFNLSHTSSSFLIGFNEVEKIGVDLEYLSGREDLDSLIEYAFSPEEADYCKNGTLTERFLEIWTLKEAYLKAIGVGLVDNLKSLNVYGTSNNAIYEKEFTYMSLICPNGETASIIFRDDQSLTTINLT